jgi:hypothetical protein
MQAAAQEHQTMGTFHQRREDIRRERVDRERGGVAFGRRAALLYGVDARVVDDRVHVPEGIDLIGNAACFGGTAKIAHHDIGAG